MKRRFFAQIPFLALLLGLLFNPFLSPLVLAANRVALVIGNADYANARLANPVKDARDISKKLTELGFKVQLVENMTHKQIGRTMAAFSKSLHPGDEVVVFYAGHGLQVKGVNYFPVVDADIQSEEDVPQNSLNLNTLLETMDDARAGVKLLFLDACRNNPFARRFRGGERGLARIGAAPSGTLIHFATRPGGVADDGSKGGNGLYTSALLRYMDAPGLSVETMVKRVAAAVEQDSKGKQEPWSEGSIKGEFYFKLGTQALESAPLDAQQAAWQVAERANSLAAPTLRAGQVIKDCDVCPALVLIPGGSFSMGSNDGPLEEKPPHKVTVRSFLLGQTEVTQAQWQAVMGSNPSKFQEFGGACPVERVSWHDAKAFVAELSKRSGKTWRLPSEAEWEYAARAGNQGKWGFGNGETRLGGHAWFAANSGEKTHAVASRTSNGFGLFDMHGNVWEWVDDCWHATYENAPNDGSAWLGTCISEKSRVLRGGSWMSGAADTRVAHRVDDAAAERNNDSGFRVAQSLP